MLSINSALKGANLDVIKEEISKGLPVLNIKEAIDLEGDTLCLPAAKVIRFSGGNIDNGTLDINGAFIEGPGYPIFGKHLIVIGKFGNSKIKADWFETDGSEWIQKAVDCSNGSEVIVGNALLKKTLNITKDGTKFTCLGMLNVADSCDVAINLCGKNQIINIRSLVNPNVYTDTVSGFKRTGIKITDDLINSKISIGEMMRFSTGFEIVKKGIFAPRVHNNEMDFMFIRSDEATQPSVCFDIRRADFCNNTVHGGRLMGADAIKIEKGTVRNNTFTNIGFEGIKRCCLDLSGVEDNRFEYLRMSESLPESDYIRLLRCEDNVIHLKSGLSYRDLVCYDNGLNKIHTYFGIDFKNETNIDYGFHGVNIGYTSSDSLLMLSSIAESSGYFNEINYIDIPSSNAQMVDTLKYYDLCVRLNDATSDLQVLLPKVVKIKVGANRKIVLSLINIISALPLNKSIIIDLELEDKASSKFELRTQGGISSVSDKNLCYGDINSGIYRLEYVPLEELVYDNHQKYIIYRWYPVMIKD